MPAETYIDVLNWVPKGILLFSAIALSFACWAIIKYVVKTKHGEIMDKFTHLDKHLLQLRDNVMHLSEKVGAMVTSEQHKETKREIKESLFEMKDQFQEKLDELKKRVQHLEANYDINKRGP